MQTWNKKGDNSDLAQKVEDKADLEQKAQDNADFEQKAGDNADLEQKVGDNADLEQKAGDNADLEQKAWIGWMWSFRDISQETVTNSLQKLTYFTANTTAKQPPKRY